MLTFLLFVAGLPAPPPVTLEDGGRLPGIQECHWHCWVADRQLEAVYRDKFRLGSEYLLKLRKASRAQTFWTGAARYHDCARPPIPPFKVRNDGALLELKDGRWVRRPGPGEALTHLRQARKAVSGEDWKAGRWPVPPFCLFSPADWAVVASVR